MNIYHHPYLSFIWLLKIFVELWLVFVIFFRPCQLAHRYFGIILSFDVLTAIALFTASALNNAWAYHFVYWIAEPCLTVLVLIQAVISFGLVFGPYRTMPRNFFYHFFLAVGVCSLAIAAVFIFVPSHRPFADAALFTVLQSYSFWLCGVFWLISIFADHYGLPCATRSYGIVIGYLIRYTTAVLWALAYAHLSTFRSGGMAVTPMYTLQMISDLGVALVWMHYFCRIEPPAPREHKIDRNQLSEFLAILSRQRKSISGLTDREK